MILTVSAQLYYSHLEWLLRLHSSRVAQEASVFLDVRRHAACLEHSFFAGNRSPKFDSEIAK